MNNNRSNIKNREEIIYPNRYNFLNKKKPTINPESQKKRKRHIIEVALAVAAFLVALVVLEIAIFSGYDSTAKKSKDEAIKANIEVNASKAFDYAERHGGSFQGFIPVADEDVARWGESLVINISSDGRAAAIFMKSAEKQEIYFCADLTTVNPDSRKSVVIYEVSEKYAKQENFSCF